MKKLIDANEILKSEHQHYDYMADEYYVLVRDIELAPTLDAMGDRGYRVAHSRRDQGNISQNKQIRDFR